MSSRNREGRAPARRAFQPSLDGPGLETRILLSSVRRANVAAPSLVGPQTAAAGSAVVLTTSSGQRFYVSVGTVGTVRATVAGRNGFRLILEGTTEETEVTINPLLRPRIAGSAHTFSPGAGSRNGLVKISGINVVSGRIGAILGYRTTQLTGPVVVGGSSTIDRIAFYSIEQGGSISTGGDVNTLDVFADANLRGGAGIFVGRDLNYLNVGGNLSLTNGANLTVQRYFGLVPQQPKGTEVGVAASTQITGIAGLRGALIQSSFAVGANSGLIVGGALRAPFVVLGQTLTNASSTFNVPTEAEGSFFLVGGQGSFSG